MDENWIEHEIKNWVRYCWSGAMPHPVPWESMGRCLSGEGKYVRDAEAGSAEQAAIPVHMDNAKKVQEAFDAFAFGERKVLRAEYLSPWDYGRYKGGIEGAARRLEISVGAYETVLLRFKNKIQRVFE
jgi:hypothetical protein